MALSNGPNLGLLVNGSIGEEHYDELMAMWRGIDGLIMPRIIDRDLATPPGSPSDGNMYIVAGSPTGAWVGHTNEIARWSSVASAWEFYVPKEGWIVWLLDEEYFVHYTGSVWVMSAVFGPASTTDSHFARFDGTNGHLLKGGIALTTSTTLSGATDAQIPSALAAKTYIDDHRTQSIIIACSDETTALTTGTAKATFRLPYAFTLTGIRASLTTAQASGSIFTVDVNEALTSILSTKITIDNTEKTSTTAATQPVISDSSLADDAEITIDIDQIGTSGAAGLKVTLIGYKT